MLCGRQVLARVVLADGTAGAPRLPGPPIAAAPAGAPAPTGPAQTAATVTAAPPRSATELHFQGECIARAVAVHAAADGPDRYSLRVYLAPTASTGYHAQVAGIGRGGQWSFLTVSDAQGRPTYRVRVYGTFFVRHLVFYDAQGRAVGRAARARPLPRQLWLWEPRTATHGRTGSWTFELSPKDDCYIHPALPILLAAQLGLDEEARQGARLWDRLRTWWPTPLASAT